MKRILISAAITVALFGSCTKEIEYTGPASKPMLIINSLTCSGKVPSVSLSASTPFLETFNSNNIIKSLASVTISINGIPAQATYVDSLKSYSDSRILNDGDIITITATDPDYGTATATDTVPHSQTCSFSSHTKKYVPVISWDDILYNSGTDGNSVDSTWVVSAEIQLPDNKNHFYFLSVEPTMTYYRLTPYGMDTIVWDLYYSIPTQTRIMLGQVNATQEIQNSQTGESLERGVCSYLFSGQNLKAGNSLDFEVLLEKPDTLDYCVKYDSNGDYLGWEPYSIADSIVGEPEYRTNIKLYVLSNTYYYYHKSVNDFRESDGSFLTEPVTIIHNVKGGAGIVATYSGQSYSIKY